MIGQRQCLELLANDSSMLQGAEMGNEKAASAAASLHLVTSHAERAQRGSSIHIIYDIAVSGQEDDGAVGDVLVTRS